MYPHPLCQWHHTCLYGLIGSKRRVAGLFENLCTEGIDRSFLDQIHTPIGLAIGAVTTDEIAISILSELILCRSRLSLWKKNGILEQTNLDPVFLNALHTEGPKAIAVVVDRKGSTPVKTGAIMCVNALGQSFGTIGGGCGEHEVLRKALEVLSDKKDMFLSVDMTNDFAGEGGHGVRRNDGCDHPICTGESGDLAFTFPIY